LVHFEGDIVTVLGNIKYNSVKDTIEIGEVLRIGTECR
jgi:hypothetical protein